MSLVYRRGPTRRVRDGAVASSGLSRKILLSSLFFRVKQLIGGLLNAYTRKAQVDVVRFGTAGFPVSPCVSEARIRCIEHCSDRKRCLRLAQHTKAKGIPEAGKRLLEQQENWEWQRTQTEIYLQWG